MGGKKKGLSNRLAKMSDEERARYLQHRAAIEEEAKRRKEQLIATYMKNKLKREEAFTRLNIAKINEHWHQILRKIKVKGLKTEIDDLRIWITKILEIKDSIIKRLIIETEESEEQYQINLKSHLSHVDNFIDMHYERQYNLETDYEQHRETVLNDAKFEMNILSDKSFKEERYLKTVLFGMEKNFNDFMKEMKVFRDSKLQDYSNSLRTAHETMAKRYGQEMGSIWRDINHVLRGYLTRTTQKRHHYIELKHLDERNEVDRLRNEKRLQKHTEMLHVLNMEHEMLYDSNENQIKDLKVLRQNVSKEFQDLKRNLTSTIRHDEKILQKMAVNSNNVIKDLKNILEKGDGIRNFVTCCSRLETPDEKLIHWAKFQGKLDRIESVQTKETVEDEEDDEEETMLSRMLSKQSSEMKSFSFTPQESFELEVYEKYLEKLPEEFHILSKMDGMWWCCNRAEIESGELRKERSTLAAENRNMKQIIKGILKDAALETPPPKDICFPVYSKIKSGPIQSKKLDLHGLDFLVIDL